ncbi:hypothetical protein P43SY_000742 [Pythium insidiosum]|uniref:Uncharacterized protein n=1 Tax=Pythium insidiosum TaxID=114742 RepID=A0AAD5QEJ4_PYTIN|nr:hypothetical protein P43SY_000742 [Pythium insidiosum]
MTTTGASPETLGQWLGETLHIIKAAASVRDPRVLNALWPRHECEVVDCGFCDALDANVQLEITLDTQGTTALKELSFVAMTDDADVMRRSILALVCRVGHNLRSLSITAHRPYLDGSIASEILSHCPNLNEMSVEGHDASFLEEVVLGYRDGRCRITTLSLELLPDDNQPMTTLLRALSDDKQNVTRWLKRLVINRRHQLDAATERSVVDALLSMLHQNRTLRMLVVRPPFTDVDARIRLGQLGSSACYASQPPSRRHRLALLSALDHRMPELPECVLLHVWAFSGRPVWRLR